MLNEDKLFNIGMENKDNIEPILMDLYNADWKNGVKLFLSALNHYSKLKKNGDDNDQSKQEQNTFAQKYLNHPLFAKKLKNESLLPR